MANPVSRSQFLRGNFTGKRSFIRPPWTGSEASFVSQCSRCDACLKVCPEHILIRDSKGFPCVDFHRGECTFCAKCVTACNEGVFDDSLSPPWALSASINQQCLPYQGVVCGRCSEECEMTAINMKLVAGGITIPVMATDNCNGCGACYRVCPTQAIELSYGENA